MRTILRIDRHLPANKPDNFALSTAQQMVEQFRQTTAMTFLVMIVLRFHWTPGGRNRRNEHHVGFGYGENEEHEGYARRSVRGESISSLNFFSRPRFARASVDYVGSDSAG
jgi:hypothetical protein